MKVPRGNDTKKWFMVVGIALIAIAIITFLAFLMHGEVKVDGAYSGLKETQSMTCNVDGMRYPFFRYDNSIDKKTFINIIFNDDALESISLVYTLNYSNNEDIRASEAENHGAMNLRFQAEGLGPDALGAKYACLSSEMKMSLYATKSEVNAKTDKYFYLNDIDGYTLSSIQKAYERLGFDCFIKTDEGDLDED